MSTKKTALVTGGAGFVGSHLVDRLLADEYRVFVVDNLATGSAKNLDHLSGNSDVELLEHDIVEPLSFPDAVDVLYNMASPASPADYLALPLETLRVGSCGTRNMLELAREKKARFLMASTSEVYGDPQIHPQEESYWGNVNPIGPRSVYDEAKRFSEALTVQYRRSYQVETRIVRIFNTYGPRMRPNDGRVVPAFCCQSLKNEPMTVFGDGSQTRSFCYVTDLVRGLQLLMDSSCDGPVNIGNPLEMTVLQFAEKIRDLCGSSSEIAFKELPEDDPKIRQPDITRAREILGWEPQMGLEAGLRETIAYFSDLISLGKV
ncbi:MAG: dTDP-glucose 4,6-dehydratase [Kiritimatiellia bacterium]